ncbi:hypothetical protein SLE2022_331680 [Rubroshorea leprosula]
MLMDGPISPNLDSNASELVNPETQASKRRKVVEKTVVTVKINEENAGKLKNEGLASDLWSWRKYGQKPIKGSPYPRGYYRCSTSKGCSAKKQVERCRTDASVLVITYTSSHNHPGPDLPPNTKLPEETQPQNENHPNIPKPEQEPEEIQKQSIDEDHFHYIKSPLGSPQGIIINQEDPFSENLEKPHEAFGFLLDEEPLSACPHLITTFSSTDSTPKSEDNDFFDELEELPISLGFTSFMKTKFFHEEIPAVPS